MKEYFRSSPDSRVLQNRSSAESLSNKQKSGKALSLPGRSCLQCFVNTPRFGDINVSTKLNSPVIQREIVRGKTKNSSPYLSIALTNWFKGLPSDTHRAFARMLHDEYRRYTKVEAEKIINKKIKNGDKVPVFDHDENAERRKRVRKFVNDNAPDKDDKDYIKGRLLTRAAQRAYNRHERKLLASRPYEKRIRRFTDTIEDVEPGLLEDQKSILDGENSYLQIYSLTNAKPKSFNFIIDNSEIKLDAIDVKSNKEREKSRKRKNVHLPQVFIEQSNKVNSYRKMSELKKRKFFIKNKPHKLLRHLEVQRNPKSVFTTYMKDELLENRKITPKQAFGTENFLAFQEFEGALKPSENMKKMQELSAQKVLLLALNEANRELGTQVKDRELTTSGKIMGALKTYSKSDDKKDYKMLVKEIFRFIRSMTKLDIDSDSDSDSDSE